ncbi:hypothetical protein BCT70_011280 [Vibrio lentus]|uniref:GTPase-associated system all-helical protein GASH n=1 Tax=Vibrio TaxID=662 RepID=UPI000C85B361|nr:MULTISPECIES: GTPase-associated system all-helical protein GASH [Vibrio]MCB5461760.1 hypothetical protein [Vibrio lentus]MCC4849327.1 hypothetical protein [Vibrio lentus]MCC5532143.1 hypothetical protein [Vibrio lentus]MCC5535422.1 hypothetical protein [Vibrio lentus]MCC5567948.1 hypothetical protein [Vibrio lentus]
MSNILETFLGHDLIEGDDSRYQKVDEAAESLAEKFRNSPPLLITGVLTGLNPNASSEMTIIALAKDCVLEHWKSFATAYTEEPINLYRGVILRACELVSAESNYANIMWLTACDSLQLFSLGKEEEPLRAMLENFAYLAEKNCTEFEAPPQPKEKVIKFSLPEGADEKEYPVFGKERFLTNIGAASGPNYSDFENTTQTPTDSLTPNPYWPNNAQHWSYEFNKKMATFLSSEFTKLQDVVKETDSALNNTIHHTLTSFSQSLEKELNQQRLHIQRSQAAQIKRLEQEASKVNTLWWSEALYSPSQHQSYRELSPELACILMAGDLFNQVTAPTPASVAFALSETVNKLSGSSFDKEYEFFELLTTLRQGRSMLNKEFLEMIHSFDITERLNIFETISITLSKEELDLHELINSSLIPMNWKCNLPALSRAFFRQLQAYSLTSEV